MIVELRACPWEGPATDPSPAHSPPVSCQGRRVSVLQDTRKVVATVALLRMLSM